MVTPEQLETLAEEIGGEEGTVLRHAAYNLRTNSRIGLETAHNLVTDVGMNLALSGRASATLDTYDRDLMSQRIDAYGAVGRPADMAPDRRRGW